jgi:hypothetical protein
MFVQKPNYEYRKIDSFTDRVRMVSTGFPALSKFIRENPQVLRDKNYGMFGVYSNKERRFVSVMVTAKSVILINSMHILMYEVRAGYSVLDHLSLLFDFFIEQSDTEPCITASMPNALSPYAEMFKKYGMKEYEITVDAMDVGIQMSTAGMVQTTILVRTHGLYERISALPRRVSPTFPRIREFIEVENRPHPVVFHPALAESMA